MGYRNSINVQWSMVNGQWSMVNGQWFTIVLFVMLIIVCSCHGENGEGTTAMNGEATVKSPITPAERMILDVQQQNNFDREIFLIDSLEQTGDLSQMKANYWRSNTYISMSQYRTTEFYLRKVIDADIQNDDDFNTYCRAATSLTTMLLYRNDHEGVLNVASKVVETIESHKDTDKRIIIILLNNIANSQLNLGHIAEARQSYEHTFNYLQQETAENPSEMTYRAFVDYANAFAIQNNEQNNFSEGLKWAERTDSLLKVYQQQPEADPALIEELLGGIVLNRAIAHEGLGNKEAAAAEYKQFSETKFGHDANGRFEAVRYLLSAGKYEEAADELVNLDHWMELRGEEWDLDNIRKYLTNKYYANLKAGRRDSALAVATRLCDAIDSAVVKWERDNTSNELVNIYDTQKKETELAGKDAQLSEQRFWAVATALILLTLFFIVYAIYRRMAAKRLSIANKQLELRNQQLIVANARAEESARMKTDFIQQISHEIRTPLNILSGFAQIITSPDMTLEESEKNDINNGIIENTNRITGLVNKMLELSEANSRAVIPRENTVTPQEIAEKAIQETGIMDATHIRFTLNNQSEKPLTTHLKQATRALVLLLDNAQKFTRPAEATVQTEGGITGKEDVTLSIQDQTDGIAFIIEDTGIGIPPEEAEHIFEEFVQLDEYYDGTGIGLTVARSIARRLGGDIRLDTTYTHGARFIFTLPF